jgi:hypothetical protein
MADLLPDTEPDETNETKPRPAKRIPELRSITITDIAPDLYNDLTNLGKALSVPRNTLCVTMLRDSVARYKNPLL